MSLDTRPRSAPATGAPAGNTAGRRQRAFWRDLAMGVRFALGGGRGSLSLTPI
ncbi:hypothetical protein [Streptomyces alfalfae]